MTFCYDLRCARPRIAAGLSRVGCVVLSLLLDVLYHETKDEPHAHLIHYL